MVVKTLIEKLMECNPNAVVKLHHRDDEEVLFVMSIEGDNDRIWLETESDNDMYEELSARFESASEDYNDETDFYSDLLDLGIDVDMVRKYMDDEVADHMKEYCKEHGLL